MSHFLKLQFKTAKMGVIFWSIALFLMTLLTASTYPQIEEQTEQIEKIIEKMEWVKAMMGDIEITSFNGFMVSKMYSMLPFFIGIYMVTMIAQIISKEKENGTLEYYLSLPINRTQYILIRVFVVAVYSLIIHTFVLLGTIVGEVLVKEEIVIVPYLYMLLNSWVLVMSLGLLLLVFTLFINDYTKSLMIGLAMIIVLYIQQVLLQTIEVPQIILEINPFYHYQPADILKGEGNYTSNITLLSTIGIVSLIMTNFLFRKKEV